MKKATLVLTFIAVLSIVVLAISNKPETNQQESAGEPDTPMAEESETDRQEEVEPKEANLNVPYINEAPENIWTGSWKNACEEATIAMVEYYYQGQESVSLEEAKTYLQRLFDAQQRTYGSDANSDAKRTLEIIKANTNFDGEVVENPTIEDIKNELDNGHPVIAFHRGFDLQNKNIPFLATGSSYHTTVIKGYDEENQQFITQDPGDSTKGANHPYGYDLFMNSLHDYQYETQMADGPARVIFTRNN